MRKKFALMAALAMVCFVLLAFSPLMQAKYTIERVDTEKFFSISVEWVDTDKFVYSVGEPVILTYHTMMHCLRGDITITNVRCQEVVYEPNPWIMGPCFFGPYDGELQWDQTYHTYYGSMSPWGDEHNGEPVPAGFYKVEAGGAMAYFFIRPATSGVSIFP